MSVLVVDGRRVAEVRDGRVELLGVLPAGVQATAFRPGARVVAAAGPPGMVVDLGAGGTRVRHDGRVVAAIPLGGRDLDRAVQELVAERIGRGRAALPGLPEAEARAVREALSLCPAATVDTAAGPVRVTREELGAALAPVLAAIVARLPRGRPLLLVGGVARTPLLAELCDAAGVGPVRVAERPETALLESALVESTLVETPLETTPLESGPAPADLAGAAVALPAPPPRSRTPRVLAVAAGLLAAVALLGLGTLLPVPADGLVAHGYRLAVPPGWVHAGGAPELRRVLLAPAGQPDATAAIVVERTPLGYDADVEPARAAAELRALAPPGLALWTEGEWTRYREGDVEWWVRFDRTDQLAVGCRAAAQACAVVRDSLVRDR
ncbi:hypothetical protein [Pseudonocardia oroxyli]|uniref:Type VII secretion-associated protein, Rv3446c family, C-terminal domain-containing protein n=1 Tax=Pseudonocardia oroxyli TaxID=366584 RepID=A0A1G7GKW3_PSEOR|nr:hypothetical protein [Pseudonocardia oroxyli]SDE88818.1 hypothetical protein SAMN05216377_102385 [Pseudonocardia oroxyli]